MILAGGSGERFWPLSTPKRPKQFLQVFGAGGSLLRQSVMRLMGLVRHQDVYVVTARELVTATRRDLPELPARHVIGEPMRRDTGAAVALGVGLAGADDRDVIGFFPSDQLVGDPRRFQAAVKKAVALAAKTGRIVTLGIQPTFPATGFGYVDPADGRFVEKPDEATARGYLERGFLWNAGIFIASAATFRAALATHAPELLALAAGGATRRLAAVYERLPRISFDYAVMEPFSRAGGVAVVPGAFGWDDVGSYAAFDTYYPHDDRGNVREGPCTLVEADGNICVAQGAALALLGVRNLVVVTTKDAVLVADKAWLPEMKRLFKKS